MNINTAFPSKYLKAADAEEDLILTIKTVEVEKVGEDKKPVVYFREQAKGMVLNKTNAKMISKIAKSENTEDWTGTQVRIIATEVEFSGDLVMSLRVRELKKAARSAPDHAPVDAPDDSEIPF